MKTAFSDVELDEKEYRFVGELNSQAYTYASQTDEWKIFAQNGGSACVNAG